MAYRRHLWNYFLVYFFAFAASFAVLARAIKIKRKDRYPFVLCVHQATMQFYEDWYPRIRNFIEGGEKNEG